MTSTHSTMNSRSKTTDHNWWMDHSSKKAYWTSLCSMTRYWFQMTNCHLMTIHWRQTDLKMIRHSMTTFRTMMSQMNLPMTMSHLIPTTHSCSTWILIENHQSLSMRRRIQKTTMKIQRKKLKNSSSVIRQSETVPGCQTTNRPMQHQASTFQMEMVVASFAF